MDIRNIPLNKTTITINPLHSESSNSLVSSMLNPTDDTMTNFILNDHISGESGIH